MRNFKITDEAFARGFVNCEIDDNHARLGSAYKAYAEEMPLDVDEDLGLATVSFGCSSVNVSYHSAMWVNGGGLQEKADKAEDPEIAADYLYLKEQMEPLNVGGYLWSSFNTREAQFMDSGAGWGGTWGGHAVPDLVDFATYGTDALREKVCHYRDLNSDVSGFYEGILRMLDAIDILGQRARAEALRNLESATDPKAIRRLTRLAKAFERCPKEPALTFAEACSVYIMVYSLDGVDSPGHFDWFMGDFWDRSDETERREVLEDVWEYFHNTRTWNLCISGSDENWNDKTNDLSYAILEVARKYKYQTPNITMRCHRNTPEKLLRAAAQTIATGIGMPTLYNDEAVCPALERLGISPADAHEYIMNGCNQIDIQGKSHMGLEDGEVNLGMAVELVFTNGVSRKKGYDFGAKTGDVESLDTFDKFYAAVKEQVHTLCDLSCAMSNKAQRAYAKHSFQLIRSLTIKGCLEKGRDYKDGGPLYGHGQILAEGVADAADSIAAVKKYVFEEGRFTLKELSDALAANFEGYEEIYKTLKDSDLRFGNDMEYVDSIAKDLVDDYNTYLLTKPTVRGGLFGGGCSPFTRAPHNGRSVAALPNGKRADEEIYGDSIGATPGFDVNGPTALLSSCLVFDHKLPTSGFILNIRFDKALFNTEKGIEGFLSLYRAYFDEGCGQQLSVTVVSRDDLLDAMENPDAHRDLIVRVGGYSDYFVNLPNDLKLNVLARTDYGI